MDERGESGLARDILNAVGADFAAFVVAFIAYLGFGTAGIPILMMIGTPVGIIVVYGLLVGYYAMRQVRSGRRRRAILAGSIGAIVVMFLIYVGMHLNIA